MTVTLPAIGYARVSTDEQAREGVSLEVQRERIHAYATAKGLELVDVLTDDGVSGWGTIRQESGCHQDALVV